jgi:4-hydroxyphenylpyruvate dioxygenase
MEPTVEKDEFAKWFVRGFILTETVHVERKKYMFSQVMEWKSDYNPEPTGLKYW